MQIVVSVVRVVIMFVNMTMFVRMRMVVGMRMLQVSVPMGVSMNMGVLMRVSVFVWMAVAARMAVTMIRVRHGSLLQILEDQAYNNREVGDIALEYNSRRATYGRAPTERQRLASCRAASESLQRAHILLPAQR